MPPRSPLPQRNGLDPAWLRTPNRVRGELPEWQLMRDWLHSRVPYEANVDQMISDSRFVYEDGSALRRGDPYTPHTFVWFHRDLREEATVPGAIHIVHRDERLVVIDKPPFLSSIPRGRHVLQSVVVRMRAELGLTELTPAHRLDRVTSGLLVLTTEQRWRGAYQSLFQNQQISKIYRAVAPLDPHLKLPLQVQNHIAKEHGIMQAEVVPGAPPNARTLVELESDLGDGFGVYRLTPKTGRTHQLRLHLNGLGIPIVGDPLYPVPTGSEIDDFSTPLQLLASELSFVDPIDGSTRKFTSQRSLPLKSELTGD
ncbi:pseudouridine synthase [Leucobacter denitrificans]|uniref:RNA pseudouridylate synthase n=1 Tax=Leucobacter denitrificans TaxID=683042 RepID=A0A7G9S607_9MICO|nr:pseudouridine synthase [Leucobacter denitrificans]QNN63282.1 pseudouridylate synthase [Leucobacter denitrificans]